MNFKVRSDMINSGVNIPASPYKVEFIENAEVPAAKTANRLTELFNTVSSHYL